MRILMSTVSYYPNISGVSTFSQLLARFLTEQGHEVFIMAPNTRFQNMIESDPYAEISIFRIKALKNPFRKGFFVPMATKSQVREIVESVEPDIVHLQDPLPMSVLLKNEARRRGIPVVSTNHFLIQYVLAYLPKLARPLMRPVIERRLRTFYNECDVVTCPTDTVAKVLRNQGVVSTIHAISNGVDLNRFDQPVDIAAIRERFNLPSDRPIVLYLGRIDKDKSLDVILKTIPLVLADRPVHFVIAGGGDLEGKLHKQIERSGLAEHVTMTGPIPHEDHTLIGLYHLADVFVIASTIETQGIVVMEAMAAHKPIVAARAGALPELVRHNHNGILFPPGDSQACAEAIHKVLADTNQRTNMGKTSRQMVEEHELQAKLRLFEELYKQWSPSSNDTASSLAS